MSARGVIRGSRAQKSAMPRVSRLSGVTVKSQTTAVQSRLGKPKHCQCSRFRGPAGRILVFLSAHATMTFQVCLLLAALIPALSLFPDQDGSFDRLATHLGPINTLFSSGKNSVVVGTGANVVASLALRTGVLSSRFVLPEGSCVSCLELVFR